MRKSNRRGHHQAFAGLLLTLSAVGVVMGGCGDEDTGSTASTSSGAGGGGPGAGGGGAGGAGGEGMGSGGAATGSGGAGGGGAGGSSTASTGTFMGSPCAGDVCDITLNGLDFTPDDGLMLYAGVVPQGSNKGFIWDDATTIANGKFTIHGAGVLEKGVAYFVNYYVDKNQNGTCELTPTDNVYRIPIAPVAEHVVADVTRDKNLSNIGCGGF